MEDTFIINTERETSKEPNFSLIPNDSLITELKKSNSKIQLDFDKKQLIINNEMYFKLTFKSIFKNRKFFVIENNEICSNLPNCHTQILIESGPHSLIPKSNHISRDNSSLSSDSKNGISNHVHRKNGDSDHLDHSTKSPRESNSNLKRKLAQMLSLNSEDTATLDRSSDKNINKLVDKLNEIARSMNAQFQLNPKKRPTSNASPDTAYQEEREILKDAIEKFSQFKNDTKKPNYATSKIPNPKLPLPHLSDITSRNSIQTPQNIAKASENSLTSKVDSPKPLKESDPVAWNRLERWKKLSDQNMSLTVPPIEDHQTYNTVVSILELRRSMLDRLRRRLDKFYIESTKLYSELESATTPFKRSVNSLLEDLWIKVGGKGNLLENMELLRKLEREYEAMFNAANEYSKSNS